MQIYVHDFLLYVKRSPFFQDKRHPPSPPPSLKLRSSKKTMLAKQGSRSVAPSIIVRRSLS